MAELHVPGTLERPTKRRKLRITDIIIFVVLLAVIIVLAMTLVTKLRLKHDVSGARAVADKVITDIQKRDGASARKLGTSKFQQSYSSSQLTNQFNTIKAATGQSPTLDRQIVYDDKSGRTVYFIYKFSSEKPPLYIRTGVVKKTGAWQLSSISGNPDESKLIVK